MYEALVKKHPDLMSLAVEKVHVVVMGSKGRADAARQLGISVRALQYFLKEHPLPKQQMCSTCALETACPEFQTGKVCAWEGRK